MRNRAAGLLVLIWLISAARAELIIGAASDLGPSSEKISAAASKAIHTRVRFTLASSGDLLQQISHGAPFDVYLSANESYIADAVKRGLVDSSTVLVYAEGRLALWSKDGSVRSLEDLRKPGVLHLAIADPQHAPYGIAARDLLEKRGLWKEVEPKIVFGENVRQAFQFAESGNAEAVITSWTLLKGRGVLLPREWYAPIRQAGGVLKSSSQSAAARKFLQFLTSAEGKKILADDGLFPP